MRSIRARFKEEERKNPNHGAYINLAKAIRGQNFSHNSVKKAFKQLVPKEEYEKSETLHLIYYLDLITNSPEEGEKRGKNLLGRAKTQYVEH